MAGPLAVGLAESISWATAERERGVARHRRRGAARFGINTAVWAESVGVAMLTTNVLKDAVGRPRPLTHLGEPALTAEGRELDGDFGRSFPQRARDSPAARPALARPLTPAPKRAPTGALG